MVPLAGLGRDTVTNTATRKSLAEGGVVCHNLVASADWPGEAAMLSRPGQATLVTGDQASSPLTMLFSALRMRAPVCSPSAHKIPIYSPNTVAMPSITYRITSSDLITSRHCSWLQSLHIRLIAAAATP